MSAKITQYKNLEKTARKIKEKYKKQQQKKTKKTHTQEKQAKKQ